MEVSLEACLGNKCQFTKSEDADSLGNRHFLYLQIMKITFLTGFLFIVTMVIVASSCGSSNSATTPAEQEAMHTKSTEGDTVKIQSDKTEYEIIIIEPGFNFWLQSTARPEGYYSQSWLENRNQVYVLNWNQRVLQPQDFDPRLYEMQISYDSNIDYGYELNYKLYNYFIYFQRKYNQRLGPFVPRI